MAYQTLASLLQSPQFQGMSPDDINAMLSQETIATKGFQPGNFMQPNQPAPVAPPQLPQNYIKNNQTGKVIDMGYAAPQQGQMTLADVLAKYGASGSSPVDYMGKKGYMAADGSVVGMDDQGPWRAMTGVDSAAGRKRDMENLKFQEMKQRLAGGDLERQVKQAQLDELMGIDPSARVRSQGQVQPGGMTTEAANQKFLERKFGKAPTGYRWDQQGQAVAIPGIEKPLTEFQGKSTNFGARAAAADAILTNVGKGGEVQPGLIKRTLEAVPFIGDSLGTMANATQSPEQQRVEQAQRDFVNAVLRQESGAAISAGEFDNARKQYFPQPGDSKEVVLQKARNREQAIAGFAVSAGGGGAKTITAAKDKAQAIFDAHKAISKGAPVDAVRARLEQMGVTNSGI